MSTATATRRHGSYIERPSPSSLADVVEIILDKGLVIDAYVRVSLVGIEVLTIDARIVIASVDTYLRFAEATNRLDLEAKGGRDLPELFGDSTESASEGKVSGAISGAKDALMGDDDEEEEAEEEEAES
ncbi:MULTISPECIES: gas vesicle protein GvpJ [unclassified Pseudactinotalea]|uniref:gas vesicle protein GvpJ n=1 Tax=Micrococcales TaxID=85006 RepID=UPI003C7B31E0